MSAHTLELHASPTRARAFTVEAIEQQIHAAWSDLGDQAERSGTAPPLRTSILTLVVIARGPTMIQRARTTLLSLAQVLPSRVVLVAIRDDVQTLAASVSAHCSFRTSNQASCYEIIEIEANPANLRAIPSILNQLEKSDLTTFTWWAGQVDLGSDAFRRISGVGERVIIDTARFDKPLEAMRHYAEFVRNHDHLSSTDLTWNRLLPWRELLAQSFDIPAAQAVLPDLRRIDITFDPGSMAGALLIAGWITSRLGFEPAGATETIGTITCTADNGKHGVVRVNLSQVASEGIGLRSTRLVAHTGRTTSRVTVRHIDRQLAAVSVEMTGMPAQERIVRCLETTDVEVVGQELMQFGRDRIYENALDHAARFATMLQHEEVIT